MGGLRSRSDAANSSSAGHKAKRKDVLTLTSLRFFFALAVFLHHLDMFGGTQTAPAFNSVFPFLDEGFFGVDFFFVLSGFVISYSCIGKPNEGGGATFILHRIFRLWPIYLVALVSAVILHQRALEIDHLLVNIFMLQSVLPADPSIYAFNYNAVAWSVSTELCFYIAFLFLVKVSTKRLLFLFFILFAIIGITASTVGTHTDIAGWLYYINPGFRLINFVAGMLIFRMTRTSKVNIKTMGIRAFTVIEFFSIAILLAFAFVSAATDVNSIYKHCLYYLFPAILLIFVFQFEAGAVSRLLKSRVLVFLGECSYAFYLVHQQTLYAVNLLLGLPVNSINILIVAIVSFAATTVISIILTMVVGRPLNRALRKLWVDIKAGYAKRQIKEAGEC